MNIPETDIKATNKFTVLQCIVLAASIGYLAAGISTWFLVALVLPFVIGWFASNLLYDGGFLRGSMEQSNRNMESWTRILKVVSNESDDGTV